MDGLTVEHSFFELLRQDHKSILDKLATLGEAPVPKESVQWLWDHAEIMHHEKEEKILFNSLLEIPQVNAGGPLCMIYFDQYIMNSPLERAKARTKSMPAIEEHQQKIFDQASAMRIPVNEHRAGKEILRYLLQKWDALTGSEIADLLREYKDIQIDNINKEENCFYYMCATLLKPGQADDLHNRWTKNELDLPEKTKK